jgi:serine-type D-Ala-D-Ala carboxypeptidase/endopeptidase (penicillin-binding protein 4)
VKNTRNFGRRSRRSRGRSRRRIAAIALLAVVAFAAFWVWSRLHTGRNVPPVVSVSPTAIATPVTPVATVTATPSPWSNAQIAVLNVELRDAFAPALDGADRWSLAVLGANGAPLYADHADRAVTPASVQKLVVAATALRDLGPAFRYHTFFAAAQPVARDGALDGNLWFLGSGDPSLRSTDLLRGVTSLEAGGLRRIQGGVAVDAGAHLEPEINSHWDPGDADEDFQAPVSAVSLDGDTVEFDVTGTSPGAAADVRIVPNSDAVHSSGAIATSEGSDDVVIAARKPNSFELEGDVPAGTREKFWVPVHGMPRYVGLVLARMLGDRGIETTQPPSISQAPLDSVILWDHRSAPLPVLETHMLFHSDNHYAEQLLRTLGDKDMGVAADAQGIAAEERFLGEANIPSPGLLLVDGSGLAAANRIAAVTLVSILNDAATRGGDASLYYLLPAGGREGTLKYYDFTTALGRVRAKSGHIGGVSSLAGYVNTLHHGRIAFAFLINGSPGNPDSAIVRAVNRLATF